VVLLVVVAVVLAVVLGAAPRSVSGAGRLLPRPGPVETVDQNDVGDPFVLLVPPGITPPADVPYLDTGPDAYQSAPWSASTAAMAKARGWYVLFGTTDWQENVPTAISVDLVHWTQAPDALPTLPSWAAPSISMTWAPAALRAPAGWVLYFSTEEESSQLECIGRAVSSTPAGPYVDRSTRPLLCQRTLGGSIDPSVVHAPDGSTFLVWKNDGNAVGRPDALWSQRISGDGLSVVGPAYRLLGASQAWERGIVEAPAMLQASTGGYWLFYAGGSWDSNRYGTGVAFCSRVTGPCVDASTKPFLATSRTLISPGGLDTFVDHHGQRWAAFTALVLVPSTWHPGRYYYNRVLDIARLQSGFP
jgi:beta-xylosidase